MAYYSFDERHNGPDQQQIKEMLQTVGAASIEQLIDETIPQSIRLENDLNTGKAMTEQEYLRMLRSISFENQLFRTYIGLGYYNTVVPGVIQRNILENPGWYTAYTPYQAEISQGRMEALLNFQTMITDLTGMEISNASLLDESTAAAEAMHMFFNLRSRSQTAEGVNKFFVADDCFPQTIAVLQTRSQPLGIELVIDKANTFVPDNSFFGALLQYPGKNGEIIDYSKLIKEAHHTEVKIAVAADLLSLALLKPPGEWGADCVVGSSQRFGVPLGYGGPHAAFFATKEAYKREIPGRIIGVSVDASGKPALRMALQTREQHIKRDKATSNICTSQVLLAVMAGMYAVYHGPNGIKAIAKQIHRRSMAAAKGLDEYGFELNNNDFFDTVSVNTGSLTDKVIQLAVESKINFRFPDNNTTVFTLDETTTVQDVNDIVEVFAKANNKSFTPDFKENNIDRGLLEGNHPLSRKSQILTHPVFSTHHSETEMLRYIKRLENKDLSLTHSMIPLGSCTMKLNATSEMVPLSWAAFSNIHPFTPADQVKGYHKMINDLEAALCDITGFAAMSLQPNSGAQGEYAGLMVIRNYFLSKGQGHRDIALIPSSAHGTNPASAVMAGMKVVVVKCDHNGNVDLKDLQHQAEKHKDNLAALMVTYPSTHGVYEKQIREITDLIHQYGGQVYMDGANMNAQVGLTSPGMIGADVCHLNLHKTFAIPHGGGGPGMGPIGVAKHLVPFLPGHPVVDMGLTAGPVSAAPWGSASILLISYGYIKMMGASGLKKATSLAILNANYILKKLEDHYPVLYKGENGRVAHEMILDCRAFKQSAGIEVTDIAKRLMDYGFHAPTVSFPVAGTIMVEPTESEAKEELDRFCDAMISIRSEIAAIEQSMMPRDNNVLVNAPHTVFELSADEWNHPYSRKQAAFPLQFVESNKFWPSVKRVDNAYGDRNLVCTCPDISAYAEEPMALK